QRPGGFVKFPAAPADLLDDMGPEFRQPPPLGQRVEEVGGLPQRGLRMPERRREDAVLDMPVVEHQDYKGAVRAEPHELDVPDRRLMLRREDETCAMGDARQGRADAVEHRRY